MRGTLTIEVHLVTDIVSSPPGGPCCALINSANSTLSGTKLPYFPMPSTPPAGVRNSQWGGMEAGEQMFYASQVVDGRVSLLGGSELREYCDAITSDEAGTKCPEGATVLTPALGGLRQNFRVIAHTVAPSYKRGATHGTWQSSLEACYRESLRQLWYPESAVNREAVLQGDPSESGWIRWFMSYARGEAPLQWQHDVPAKVIATPLLGAGAKLAPVSEAAHVAACVMASVEVPPAEEAWVIRFALQDAAIAGQVVQAMDRAVCVRA